MRLSLAMHSAKIAWRAMAMLQVEIENETRNRTELQQQVSSSMLQLPHDQDPKLQRGQRDTSVIPHFYVAGPMRGLPFYNFPAFDAARDLGVELGCTITSPADLDRNAGFDPTGPDGFNTGALRAVIARDVHAILVLVPERGDGVAVLPDWEHSTGARAEVTLAKWMGLRIVSALDFKTEIEVSNG